MTQDQWVILFAPAVAGLVTAAGGTLAVVVSGLGKKFSAWLTSHNQAAAAQLVASATSVVQPAIQTGANVIAGKIASGQLDYANRAAVTAEAEREAALVAQRVPTALATLAPAAGAVVASMMGKVDALMVTGTPGLPGAAPAVAPPTIAQAADVLRDASRALQASGVTVAPPPAAWAAPPNAPAGAVA